MWPIRPPPVPPLPTATGDLLDGLLPATYPELPASPATDRLDYRLPDVDRWLRLLARHLHRRGSRNLLWWRLADELPRSLVLTLSVGFGVVAALGGGALLGLQNPLAFSFALAGLVGVPIGVTIGMAGPPSTPARLGVRLGFGRRRSWQRLGIGVAAGATAGVGIIPTSGPKVGGLLIALGVLLGIALVLLGTPDLPRLSGPRLVLHDDTMAVLGLLGLGLFIGALGGGSIPLFQATIAPSFGAALAAALSGGFSGGVLFRRPRSVRGDVLALDAWTVAGAAGGALLLGAVGWSAGWMSNRPVVGGWVTLIGGMAFGLGFAIAAALTVTASVWYRVTCLWLSLHRLTPLRLLDFLGDAHRRGVLRQVGVAYQFRHARLQDRLATTRAALPR